MIGNFGRLRDFPCLVCRLPEQPLLKTGTEKGKFEVLSCHAHTHKLVHWPLVQVNPAVGQLTIDYTARWA